MHRKMIVVELNEAERYFLEKYVNENKLPNFARFLKEGLFFETRISDWDNKKDKAWRDISPWIVWPSVYTGMTPSEHQIIGFGQNTEVLNGNCIWDHLNRKQITTGVFSNLMSYPVRRNPYSLFYIPEALANDADCFPEQYKPAQDFFVFTARNYSENFLKMALQSTYKLLKASVCGISPKRVLEVLSQIPLEIIKGKPYHRNRAMLQSKLQIDLFKQLYNTYRPSFATVHLNAIAYMQHRYWRAAEPELFNEALGGLDTHFFGSLKKRQHYESHFKDAILDAFQLADQFLGTLVKGMDNNTIITVMTGLGQQRMDPFDKIHNPELRFLNLNQLLSTFDVLPSEILTQMNPDITLNFKSSEEATGAMNKIKDIAVNQYPLFHIQHIDNQLFLEGTLHPSIWDKGQRVEIHHPQYTKTLPLFDFIRVSQIKDQSTAHHRDNGWVLCYGNIDPFKNTKPILDITEISPLLLSYFEA